jgi:hypothetical protein
MDSVAVREEFNYFTSKIFENTIRILDICKQRTCRALLFQNKFSSIKPENSIESVSLVSRATGETKWDMLFIVS